MVSNVLSLKDIADKFLKSQVLIIVVLYINNDKLSNSDYLMDGDLSLVGLRHWVGLGWNIRVSVDVPDFFIFLFGICIVYYIILCYA